MGQRNPKNQLKTLVNPIISRVETPWWCRISQPSTIVPWKIWESKAVLILLVLVDRGCHDGSLQTPPKRGA
jgi:hypothetical protein